METKTYTIRWKHKTTGEPFCFGIEATSEEEAKEKVVEDYPPEYRDEVEFL